MRTRYIITKSSFLGGWAVIAPPDENGCCEGETLDSHAEALAWADVHYWAELERVYDAYTVPEPGQEVAQW